MTSMTSVSGSNETINEAAGCSISLSGSNDVVNVAGSGYVGLISGSGDTIDMSNGSVDTVNNITGLVINGSNDVVGAGAGDSINVNGSNDVVDMANGGYVGLVSGTGDSVNMSNGGLDTVNYVYNITLNGSNDIIGAGVGDTINVNGSNDTIQMAGGGYLGLTGGSGDTVFMTGGTLDTVYNVTNISLHGSNDLISTGAGCSISIYGDNNNADMLTTGYVGNIEGNNNRANIGNSGYVGNVIGSNNSITIGTGSYVGLVSGSTNTLFMNNCTVCTLNYITNVALNGYGDIVAMGNSCSIAINGNDDSVSLGSGGTAGIIAGISDSVTISGGIVNMLSNIPGMFLYGSSNTLSAGTGDQINVMGSGNSITAGASSYVGIGSAGGNTINVGSGSTVYLAAGTGNNVNMSGGNLGSANNITGYALTGSNDTVLLGSGASVNIVGSGDVITVGTSSYVGIINANADTLNMSNGSTNTLGTVTNITVNGSSDVIATGANDSFNINGSSDVLSMGSGSTVGTVTGNSDTISVGSNGRIDNVVGNSNNLTVGASGYVGLVSGATNTVNMSSGTLATTTNVTNTTLNGSSDTANIASGNQITVNGKSDILNVVTGSTVTLTASDSGDVINGVGVNVVAAAGVSGITVNGFNNVVSGAGAASVTVAPAIAPLVSYFEANPNLSQDQIQGFESYSQYGSQLAQFLTSADITSIPANVLAMLDGYSSLYLALAGVPASVFTEDDQIEQDFAWGAANASVPSDSMSTMLQNLLPALLDTNASTKLDVSDALECLGNAEANPTQSNIIIMDTAAKLLFEMAEQPDNAKTAPLAEPYRVSLPGLTGPYEIAVQPTLAFGDTGTNELVYIKNESGGFWGQLLSALNSYITPIIDIAAIIPEPFEPAFQAAAAVLETVQAGEDFAQGDDLSGVLSVLGAVAGGLTQAPSIVGSDAAKFGSELSKAVAVAQALDGIVTGAQQGQILTAIASALGGVTSITEGSTDNYLVQLHEYAAIGAGLASAGVAVSSGDILAAISALTTAAADPPVGPVLAKMMADELGLCSSSNTTNYVPNHSLPSDAVLYLAPDGTSFYGPSDINWEAEYQNGQNVSDTTTGNEAFDLLTSALELNACIGHGGEYDYQRSNGVFYTQYADSANFSVGVWMAGAGYSEDEMDAIAGEFQAHLSKNSSAASIAHNEALWNAGYTAAQTGNLGNIMGN